MVAAIVIRRYAIALSGIVVLALFAASHASPSARSPPLRDILPLQLEEQIPVPNVAGRLDHFTADVKRRRLIHLVRAAEVSAESAATGSAAPLRIGGSGDREQHHHAQRTALNSQRAHGFFSPLCRTRAS